MRRSHAGYQGLIQGISSLHLDAAAGKGLILRRTANWRDAVELQHQRLTSSGDRSFADLHFYVIALDNLVDAAKLARKHYKGESRLAHAVAAFEGEVPDLPTLRDVMEHWDAYDHRRGRLQGEGEKKLPMQRLGQVENYMLLEHDAEVVIFGMGIRLSRATPAAQRLAEEVLAIVPSLPDW